MSPLLFLLTIAPLLLLRAPVSTAHWQYNPSPNSKSVVKASKAQFTVLTDRIVRLEWGREVNAAIWGVVNRNLPAPAFQHFSHPRPPSLQVRERLHSAIERNSLLEDELLLANQELKALQEELDWTRKAMRRRIAERMSLTTLKEAAFNKEQVGGEGASGRGCT